MPAADEQAFGHYEVQMREIITAAINALHEIDKCPIDAVLFGVYLLMNAIGHQQRGRRFRQTCSLRPVDYTHVRQIKVQPKPSIVAVFNWRIDREGFGCPIFVDAKCPDNARYNTEPINARRWRAGCDRKGRHGVTQSSSRWMS